MKKKSIVSTEQPWKYKSKLTIPLVTDSDDLLLSYFV